MTTAALTYDELKALSPCRESFTRVSKLLGGEKGWNGNKVDAAKAREAGCTFDDIIWAASALSRKDADIERRIRLWMADCAARVLHIYEKTEASTAPRNAIIASRQFARGEIGDAAWAATRAATRAAAWDTAWAAAWAATRDAARDAARAATRAAAGDAAWAATRAAAWDATRDATRAAAGDAAWAAAWAAEQAWQFDHLVARLTGEPDDVALPDRAIAAA